MIHIDKVTFGYDGPPVLSELTLRILEGLTLLVGPNGAGKSTLLKLAAGVEKPDRGTVTIDGNDLWKEEIASRRSLAYIPEHPDVTPYARIDEVMELVCGLRGAPSSEGRDALHRVGLEDLGHSVIGRLSRGQRRRVLLAAAFIGQPRVFLMDEPLEAMDAGTCRLILEWIETLARTGATLLLATHRLDPFIELADRVVSMRSRGPIESIAVPRDETSRADLFRELAGS